MRREHTYSIYWAPNQVFGEVEVGEWRLCSYRSCDAIRLSLSKKMSDTAIADQARLRTVLAEVRDF